MAGAQTASTSDDTSSGSHATPRTQLTPESDSEDSGLEVYPGTGDETGSIELSKLRTSKLGSSHRNLSLEEGELEEKDNGSDIDDVENVEKGGWTPEEERAIIRKFDRRLVLFVALLYMLSFLDRSNIGNARIAGLQTDLNLSSNQYDWLLTSFYITYIIFEWMTLMYKLVKPHIYIALCVFSWGTLASLQSLSTSFSMMLILRALLGISEAAFGPGVPFYLSFFYKRSELAYRVGLFIAAAPLATSFASSLAWVIVRLSRHGPIAPWRALFLFEGFPSILVALFAYYIIPDSPADAKYLTLRQRQIATLRLQSDTKHSSASGTSRRISFHDITATLLDPPSYLTALMFLSCNVSFSSLPVFLPTIIHSMGFTALRSQILSAPPYLISFFFVLIISSLSDRLSTRSGLIIPVAILSSCSYALIAISGAMHDRLGPTATLVIRYVAVYGASMGFFASITLIITWTLNNQHTHTGRGTGMAVLNIIGQLGPLIGTRLYPDKDGPYYVSGMSVCAGFMLGVAALAFGLRWVLTRRNRAMARVEYQVVEMEERDAEQETGLMDGRDGREKQREGGGGIRYIL